MNGWRLICSAGVGAAIGAVAWSGPFALLPVALLLPAVWVGTKSRADACGLAAAYQLGATREAPIAIAQYFESRWWIGAVLWAAAALVVALPWALFWRRAQSGRTACVAFALLAAAMPPVGIVGWLNPVTAAGALFPGTGWIGLAATFLTVAALATVSAGRQASAAGVLVLLALRVDVPTSPPASWAEIQTRFGQVRPASPWDSYQRQHNLIAAAMGTSARVVVFPETIVSAWDRTTQVLWQTALARTPDRLVLLGTEVPDAHGASANVLVAVDADSFHVVYRQRMPVPVSMWRPWDRHGTRAYGWRNAVVEIAGRRAAVLICHEEFLVWPVLHSIAAGAEVIVGCANLGWSGGTNLPQIQRNAVTAWARLFDRPCVLATNLDEVAAANSFLDPLSS